MVSQEEEEPSFDVKVYVYDISHGLAAIYAPALLGVNLDAVYHTSVVVYGNEYYIDLGIKISNPGTSKHGTPKEVLSLGKTFISKDIFEDFIEDLRTHESGKYLAEGYDIFENNCNHFTDTCLDFLVGKRLEDRILMLPQRVLLSPNGQHLRNMLGNFQP